MRFLLTLLILLSLFCTSQAAQPYSIYVIVFDESGTLEPNTSVVFKHCDEYQKLFTVEDGTVVFSTLNFDVDNFDVITIETKYGIKTVVINYNYAGSGVIYNDPGIGVDILIALGFSVVAAGSGIYYLKRRKK